MKQHFVKSLAASTAVVLVLAGCGGGGGDSAASPAPAGGGGGDSAASPASAPAPAPFMGFTVQSLLDYMNQLIAQTSETTEPEPVDSTPLPVDDTV